MNHTVTGEDKSLLKVLSYTMKSRAMKCHFMPDSRYIASGGVPSASYFSMHYYYSAKTRILHCFKCFTKVIMLCPERDTKGRSSSSCLQSKWSLVLVWKAWQSCFPFFTSPLVLIYETWAASISRPV